MIKKIIPLLCILLCLSSCKQEEISKNVFEEIPPTTIMSKKEIQIERQYFTPCEEKLKDLTKKNNSDILKEKMLYSKNNFDELGNDYLKELGINTNNVKDFACVFSLGTNKVETFMIFKPNTDSETFLNILNEFKTKLKSIYIISDETKYNLTELINNPIIVEKDEYFYFIITTDTKIIEKIKEMA